MFVNQQSSRWMARVAFLGLAVAGLGVEAVLVVGPPIDGKGNKPSPAYSDGIDLDVECSRKFCGRNGVDISCVIFPIRDENDNLAFCGAVP